MWNKIPHMLTFLLSLYCGIFTPCKNCWATKICKHGDYATIRKVAFSPCHAMPCQTALYLLLGSAAVNRSWQQLINALLGNTSVDTTIKQQQSKLCFHMSMRGFIGETGIPKKSVLGVSQFSVRDSRGRKKTWTCDLKVLWAWQSMIISDSEWQMRSQPVKTYCMNWRLYLECMIQWDWRLKAED
jgi:hypothetical protein